MSWLNALSDEIAAKKLELERMQDVMQKIQDLKAEIAKLEGLHAQATGTAPAKKTGVKRARTWTPEQKAEASAKRKAAWAAKKAATPAPTVKKAKANLA